MEHNIKRHRDSRMMQRWLGAALMEAEERFKRIRGFEAITQARKQIERITTQKSTGK